MITMLNSDVLCQYLSCFPVQMSKDSSRCIYLRSKITKDSLILCEIEWQIKMALVMNKKEQIIIYYFKGKQVFIPPITDFCLCFKHKLISHCKKCFSYLDFLSLFQLKYQKILNQDINWFSRQVKIIVLFSEKKQVKIKWVFAWNKQNNLPMG